MKKLFFVPFAFDQSKKTGVNVTKRDTFNVYMKNICVALVSAKRTTPDVDVALVCNMDIPDSYKDILVKNHVLIIQEPFDSFTFADDYQWGLAFYKLCALEKVVERYPYDYYAYADSDVLVQRSLDPVFEEMKDHIMMYDINHGLQVADYRSILSEFREFGIDTCITHYGGEFFGASRENAAVFIAKCKEIHQEMIRRDFRTTKGDEFIISVAASYMKEKIKNAGAYIFRFWTGRYYLVSTCYQGNGVAILHLPVEKSSALPYIYDKYLVKNRFPTKEKIHKLCHLTKPRLKHRLIKILKK